MSLTMKDDSCHVYHKGTVEIALKAVRMRRSWKFWNNEIEIERRFRGIPVKKFLLRKGAEYTLRVNAIIDALVDDRDVNGNPEHFPMSIFYKGRKYTITEKNPVTGELEFRAPKSPLVSCGIWWTCDFRSELGHEFPNPDLWGWDAVVVPDNLKDWLLDFLLRPAVPLTSKRSEKVFRDRRKAWIKGLAEDGFKLVRISARGDLVWAEATRMM